MKIGQNTATSLLEKMQQAHAEAADGAAKRPAGFAVHTPAELQAPATSAAPASPLHASVSAIAGRVLSGELKTPERARVEVLHAIIKDKWGDKLSPAQHRQISKSLEQNLADDPMFVQEVDQMLIHAALELGKR
jgi:hypothetical protein